MSIARRLVAKTPAHFQQELKRLYYRRKIRKGSFVTSEPEYGKLDTFVSDGDWVIDVGANVGHYTVRLSELVGNDGRVIAFEPVPSTFAQLAANVLACGNKNITLVNAAASDKTTLVGMSIPESPAGLRNYYRASISSPDGEVDARVMTVPVDNLQLDHRVGLIKIDAEGHEAAVLNGARKTLERDTPILIVESITDASRQQLLELGYTEERYGDSVNSVYRIQA